MGYSQDLASSAGVYGLTVATAQKYTSGSWDSIRQAMVNIKQANVRVIVCIAFSSDMDAILQLSEEVGTSGRGWVWLTGDAISDPNFVMETSTNAARASHQLQGWIQIQPSAFAGNKGPKFQDAWFSEPTANLNNSLLAPFTKSVRLQDTPCPEICGFAYDAVWAGPHAKYPQYAKQAAAKSNSKATALAAHAPSMRCECLFLLPVVSAHALRTRCAARCRIWRMAALLTYGGG